MRFLRRCLCVLRAGGGAGVRESVAHKWCTFGTHCGWRKDCVSPRVCTRIAPHGASTHWCRRTTQRRTQGTPKILLGTLVLLLSILFHPSKPLCAKISLPRGLWSSLGNSCVPRWSSGHPKGVPWRAEDLVCFCKKLYKYDIFIKFSKIRELFEIFLIFSGNFFTSLQIRRKIYLIRQNNIKSIKRSNNFKLI